MSLNTRESFQQRSSLTNDAWPGIGGRYVTVVALLQSEASVEPLDHVGFVSGVDFVVGYGLDVAQTMRNLPALYYLEVIGERT